MNTEKFGVVRRWRAAALLLLVSVVSTVALAQNSNPAPSANQLFDQGMAFYQNKNYPKAADAFARSFKAKAFPVTALYAASAIAYISVPNNSKAQLQNAQNVIWYLDAAAQSRTPPLNDDQRKMADGLRAWAQKVIDRANQVAESHSSSNAGTASVLDADDVAEPPPKSKK